MAAGYCELYDTSVRCKTWVSGTMINWTLSHPNIIQLHAAASSNSIHATVFHNGTTFYLNWVTTELDTPIRSDTVRTIPGPTFTHHAGVYPWLLRMYICHFPLAEYQCLCRGQISWYECLTISASSLTTVAGDAALFLLCVPTVAGKLKHLGCPTCSCQYSVPK
jgi:hypothetical protein